MTADAVECSESPVPAVLAAAAAVDVLCVHGDVRGEVLMAIPRREPWMLPIVDGAGRFLGFVSSRHVLHRRRAFAQLPAHQLARNAGLAVHESSHIHEALRAMARQRARIVALVDDDRILSGVLSDLQALRSLD